MMICRQLGYNRAHVASYYGAGSGRIWLTNVNCIGSELVIGNCSNSRWGNVESYYFGNAGVVIRL